MLAFLITVALAADPVPPPIASYFKTIDASKANILKSYETTIRDMERELSSEPVRAKQGTFRRRIQLTQKLLERARTAPPTPLRMAANSPIGAIGLLPPCTFVATIDDESVVIRGDDCNYLLTGIVPKEIKRRPTFTSEDLWQVTARETEKPDILRFAPKPASSFSKHNYYEVKIVPAADVEKYRKQYDAEQAAKAND